MSIFFFYFSPIRKILDYEDIVSLNRRNSVDSLTKPLTVKLSIPSARNQNFFSSKYEFQNTCTQYKLTLQHNIPWTLVITWITSVGLHWVNFTWFFSSRFWYKHLMSILSCLAYKIRLCSYRYWHNQI